MLGQHMYKRYNSPLKVVTKQVEAQAMGLENPGFQGIDQQQPVTSMLGPEFHQNQ